MPHLRLYASLSRSHAHLSHLTQLKLMPHSLWISKKKISFSPSRCLNFKFAFASGIIIIFFFNFFFNPHGVLVSPSVLYSLLLSFIRYWFFSFDFDFDYLILFLSFDHFLGIFILFYFIFSGFISHSSFMLVVEHLVHMMILISIFSMTNESCVIKWTFKLSSCLFETLKLICHLDVNVMTDW